MQYLSALPITPFLQSFLHSRANFTRNICLQALPTTIQPPMTLSVHLHSFPCILLRPFDFSSMWKTHLLLPYGAYRGGLHISINSFQLVLAEVHPLTLSIMPLYVLSMSSCRSRVRLLGITGGPFLLR